MPKNTVSNFLVPYRISVSVPCNQAIMVPRFLTATSRTADERGDNRSATYKNAAISLVTGDFGA